MFRASIRGYCSPFPLPSTQLLITTHGKAVDGSVEQLFFFQRTDWARKIQLLPSKGGGEGARKENQGECGWHHEVDFNRFIVFLDVCFVCLFFKLTSTFNVISFAFWVSIKKEDPHNSSTLKVYSSPGAIMGSCSSLVTHDWCNAIFTDYSALNYTSSDVSVLNI